MSQGQWFGFLGLTTVVLVPSGVSLLIGLDRKFFWEPQPALIDDVSTNDNEQIITYRYYTNNEQYIVEHTQRNKKSVFGSKKFDPYQKGDRVHVNVHQRNEKLSILDPPLFANIFELFTGENSQKGVAKRNINI